MFIPTVNNGQGKKNIYFWLIFLWSFLGAFIVNFGKTSLMIMLVKERNRLYWEGKNILVEARKTPFSNGIGLLDSALAWGLSISDQGAISKWPPRIFSSPISWILQERPSPEPQLHLKMDRSFLTFAHVEVHVEHNRISDCHDSLNYE